MSDTKHTIRIDPAVAFGKSAWVPLVDLKKVCEVCHVEMDVVDEKYFVFTADDPKYFFLLGLNFPIR